MKKTKDYIMTSPDKTWVNWNKVPEDLRECLREGHDTYVKYVQFLGSQIYEEDRHVCINYYTEDEFLCAKSLYAKKLREEEKTKKEAEWNGEGSKCEGFVCDLKGKFDWHEVVILMHKEKECAVYVEKLGLLRWCDDFRPIGSGKPSDEKIKLAFKEALNKKPFRLSSGVMLDDIYEILKEKGVDLSVLV